MNKRLLRLLGCFWQGNGHGDREKRTQSFIHAGFGRSWCLVSQKKREIEKAGFPDDQITRAGK